jgi:hypothetical protein
VVGGEWVLKAVVVTSEGRQCECKEEEKKAYEA